MVQSNRVEASTIEKIPNFTNQGHAMLTRQLLKTRKMKREWQTWRRSTVGGGKRGPVLAAQIGKTRG